MKMITAVIQPFMLSKVTHALEHIEAFPGMTVFDARGFGQEKALHAQEPHRRVEDIVDFVKKSRIEIVAEDGMVERIVNAIAESAHTGNAGDGKIFVWSIEHAVRIKTGETGHDAI